MILSMLFFLLFEINAIQIEWVTPKEHEFGTIRHNVGVKTDFKFINKSTEPVIIEAVRTTCGCTAANYPEDPILPNETATLNIEFDAHKVGFFSKKIKVFFDGQRKPEILTIMGEVE